MTYVLITQGPVVIGNQQKAVSGQIVNVSERDARILVSSLKVAKYSAPPGSDPDPATDPAITSDPEEEAETLLNLNTATKSKLRALPGVTQAVAQRLIEGAPYESLDAAKTASQLSNEAWSQVEPLVTIEPLGL